MYIKRITYQNYGPIKNIDLTFNNEGNPNPIVLIGKNGAGKTLLLSSIIDSIIEFKKKVFNEVNEVEKNKYYKLGNKDYIKFGNDYSYINIQYQNNSDKLHYTELNKNVDQEIFKSKHSQDEFRNFDINNSKFSKSGFYKNISNNLSPIKEFVNNNVLLYFPFYRFERPAWLNDRNIKIEYDINENFFGYDSRNIEKTNINNNIQKWILDLLLDRELSEKQVIKLKELTEDIPDSLKKLNVFLGYDGKNSNYRDEINKLLKIIYSSKYKNIEYARIGVSPKNNRKISIIIKEKNKEEIIVSPTFSQLSSGEIILLTLFCSILKDYDLINDKQTINKKDISGIVVIDEIDLHLHLSFQKNILPNLINQFPNIQFILTTHSPFFIMGMKEEMGENFDLIHLPDGNLVDINQFSEFNNAYNSFVDINEQYKNSFNNLKEKISEISKPLIITEGKTDWQHLKNALKKLRENGKYIDLDIEFLEFEDEIEMGDSNLKSMCKQLSKIPQNKNIICLFDRDNPSIVKEMSGDDSTGYKKWSNDVYSFCLPTPAHREEYNNISIEFYYSDDEIKTVDKDTDRKLFFSNELEEVIIKSTTNKSDHERNLKVLDNPKEKEEENKKIYDQDISQIKNEEGEQIALSKSAFARNVYNEKEGYSDFDITEFEKVFDVIKKIIDV